MSVLQSRKFWFTLITLVAILVGVGFQNAGALFEENADALAGAVTLLVVYVISLAVDPGQGWAGLLKSRKFYTLLVGLVVMVMDMFKIALPYGLTQEQVIVVCLSLGGYIVSIAVEGRYKDILLITAENKK